MSVTLKERVVEAVSKNPNKFYTVSEIAKELDAAKEEVSARMLELCKNGEIARRPTTDEEKASFTGHGARPQWVYFAGSDEDRKVWRKRKVKTKAKGGAKGRKPSKKTVKAVSLKTLGLRKIIRNEETGNITLSFGDYNFTPAQARDLYTSLQQIFN
jgi:hypothetical protein